MVQRGWGTWGPGTVRGEIHARPGYGYTYSCGSPRPASQVGAWGQEHKHDHSVDSPAPAPATAPPSARTSENYYASFDVSAPAASFHELLRLLERAHDEEVHGLHVQLASLSKISVPLERELAEAQNSSWRARESVAETSKHLKTEAELERLDRSLQCDCFEERMPEEHRESVAETSKHLKTEAELERLDRSPQCDCFEERMPEEQKVHASKSKAVQGWNAALRSRSVFDHGETLADMLGSVSVIAKVSFFIGGFWSFRREFLQRCYMFGFLLSFFVCFVTCVINWAWQTPPYFTFGTGFQTAYFHVVGLHSWWFWHSFMKDPKLISLVRGFLRDSHSVQTWEKEVISQLRLEIKLAFGLLLALQLFIVGLAGAAFAGPPLLHWYGYADANDVFKDSATAQLFSLLHGLIMIGVIPQHVPTVLASTALLHVVNVFHNYDMERLLALVKRTDLPLVEKEHHGYHSGDADDWDEAKFGGEFSYEKRAARDTPEALLVHRGIVNNCCDMVDDVQRRLDYTCQKVKWVWAHTLLYSTFQLIVAAHAASNKYSLGQDWNRALYWQFLLDLFHGLIGLVIFFSALLTPAFTTVVFVKSPVFLLHAITNRGVSPSVSAASMHFLHTKLIGFTTFFYSRVDMASVSKFGAVVMMGSALYASSAAWEQH